MSYAPTNPTNFPAGRGLLQELRDAGWTGKATLETTVRAKLMELLGSALAVLLADCSPGIEREYMTRLSVAVELCRTEKRPFKFSSRSPNAVPTADANENNPTKPIT